MNAVIDNYGKDRPTARRGDWIVTIDGHGDIPGVPRSLYRFTCKQMTLAAAIAAAVEMFELKHCPDPDEEGDIMESWQIFSVTAEPCHYVLTVDP